MLAAEGTGAGERDVALHLHAGLCWYVITQGNRPSWSSHPWYKGARIGMGEITTDVARGVHPSGSEPRPRRSDAGA